MSSQERYFCCALSSPAEVVSVVAVGDSDAAGTEALVFTKDGTFTRLESSAPGGSGFSLGEPTSIHLSRGLQPAEPSTDPLPLRNACWDAFSGCIYGVTKHAVVRLTESGCATVVAGSLTAPGHRDGDGVNARFEDCSSIVSNGEGCLYVLERFRRMRRLRLPASWRSAPPGSATNTPAPGFDPQAAPPPQPLSLVLHRWLQQQQQQQASAEHLLWAAAFWGEGTSVAGGDMQVSSVSCACHVDLAFDPSTRNMVLCTQSAVYRLPMLGNGGAGVGARPVNTGAREGAGALVGAWQSTASAFNPVLVAGREGIYERADGAGAGARFGNIGGVVVDGSGAAWVLDRYDEREPDEADEGDWYSGSGTCLRRVDLSTGVVTTIKAGLLRWDRQYYDSITVLPNGCLALSGSKRTVVLLQLGLRPPWAGPGLTSGPRNTLAADLGALLDRQPDSSADVEVEVGGQAFPVHRSVLAARSPYFRQRLDSGAGFADAGAPRLSLPDADPNAFAVVLRYLYTDSTGLMAPELLQPVGELADRLLLPGLCVQVGRQLLGRVGVESVVGLLLWAEQRAGSFGALLRGLKEWFLRHDNPEQGRVMPDGEVMRLMHESPHLALQLLYHRRADGT